MRDLRAERIENWLALAKGWENQDIARRLRIERKGLDERLNQLEARYRQMDVPIFFDGLSNIQTLRRKGGDYVLRDCAAVRCER